MCKQTCDTCKCKRGTPEGIIESAFNVVDITEFVDYDDIKWQGLIPSTTCPRNQLNKQKDNHNDTNNA